MKDDELVTEMCDDNAGEENEEKAKKAKADKKAKDDKKAKMVKESIIIIGDVTGDKESDTKLTESSKSRLLELAGITN
jgi:hypothetical protein